MDRAGEPGEGLVRRESEKGETGRPRPFFFDFWSAWWGWIFASPAVVFFACPAGATAQPLAAGCLLAAMPLRDSLCPVGAVPPYGWGVPLAGKRFSANHRTFAGADILSARQRNFTNLLFPLAERDPFSVLLVAACPAEASTAFLFDFLPARLGPKPLFLFREKKTAVLDSEKEKVDQWKSWGGAVQQDRLPVLRCCSSGERLWGVLPVSGGLGLSDPWSPLRHCR